jgi:hypothetical protein
MRHTLLVRVTYAASTAFVRPGPRQDSTMLSTLSAGAATCGISSFAHKGTNARAPAGAETCERDM